MFGTEEAVHVEDRCSSFPAIGLCKLVETLCWKPLQGLLHVGVRERF